jgi:hypothetical protein
MDDYLQRYLPEYDAAAARQHLSQFSKEELLEMLIVAYKEKRLFAKMLDERLDKENRIRQVLDEPSKLSSMPGVPGPDDLRKMFE